MPARQETLDTAFISTARALRSEKAPRAGSNPTAVSGNKSTKSNGGETKLKVQKATALKVVDTSRGAPLPPAERQGLAQRFVCKLVVGQAGSRARHHCSSMLSARKGGLDSPFKGAAGPSWALVPDLKR